jgi:integrase
MSSSGSIPAIARVRAGIARLEARPVARARALGLDELARIIASLEGGDVRALRDRALLLIGFFAALRRSEIVALDVAASMARDVGSGACGGRAENGSWIEATDEGLRIHISGGKASQARQTIAVCRRNDALCPAAALADYLAAAQITSGALFRAVSRGGRLLERRLDAASLRHILRTRAAATFAGEGDAALRTRLDRLSPHSLRAGLITAAARTARPSMPSRPRAAMLRRRCCAPTYDPPTPLPLASVHTSRMCAERRFLRCFCTVWRCNRPLKTPYKGDGE